MYQNDHTGLRHGHGQTNNNTNTNTYANTSKPPATPSAHRSSPTVSRTQSPSTPASSPLPLSSPTSTTSSATASASSTPRHGVDRVLKMGERGSYVSTLHIEIEGTDGDDGITQEQTNRHGRAPLYGEWPPDDRIFSERRVSYSITSSREAAIAQTARSTVSRSAFSDYGDVGTGNGRTGGNTAGPHN